ncbi:MAG: HAMP domain-containing sensor histidine kinase [Schlesneria sp.]
MSFVISPDRDKLEALAEFAAGAGHEINNPLATIIGRAQMLLKDETDPQKRQMLMSIGAQAYRIRDMIADTMLFGRPPCTEFQVVNLAEVVNRVLAKHKADLENGRSTVSVQVPESIVLRADSTQLSIVLSELLRNSLQALQPGGGEIQISATADVEKAFIEMTDQGVGFRDDEREHAFDPFFSGRQAGRGLGFGLPKCWRIIDQHSGQIEIQSTPNGPTTVRIVWPIAS